MLLEIISLSLQMAPPQWLNSNNFFRKSDYPVDARENRREGDVGIVVKLGTDGAPLECEVRGSSGVASLDDKSCELILKRGRFRAARNKAGEAIQSYYPIRVNWHL